jgi:hypothetical protein
MWLYYDRESPDVLPDELFTGNGARAHLPLPEYPFAQRSAYSFMVHHCLPASFLVQPSFTLFGLSFLGPLSTLDAGFTII